MPAAVATVSRSRWKRPSRARVERIRAKLAEFYGVPLLAPHGRPLDELVLTVLSQSTNDRNRDIAYLRLRDALPTWAAVRDAPLIQVEEAIRPGGISKVKSKRIQAILRQLTDSAPAAATDPLDLSWMASAPIEESRAALCALPGVARKTAACVLLFSYGIQDVPVDTHVGRVATRLGLLRPGASAEEQHDEVCAITPPGAALEFHVNLLRHGRRICHSQRPDCGQCVLRRSCPARQL
ncbi:MAG: DNA lyase [Actinomycetes bacterium]